jgi:hypothetical protein
MAAPRVIQVRTLADFAKRIEAQLKDTRKSSKGVPAAMNWYRGHSSSAKYKLEPYLYRHKVIRDVRELMKLEDTMMTEFSRHSMLHTFHQATDDPKDRMQLLFYMQHNGVPTRLLDWSSNPFIALYFALSGAKRDDSGVCQEPAAVWVLDPYRWNRHALGDLGWEDHGPATSEDERIKSYLPRKIDWSQPVSRYPLPIAISGAANTARMMAQRGNFTIFSDDLRPMEVIYDTEGFIPNSLVKLEVAAGDIDSMLQVLLAVGYTDSVAYPDLEGLAMEIKRLHGFIS